MQERSMKRFFRVSAFVALMATVLVACENGNFEEVNPNQKVELTSVDIVAALPEASRVELGDDTGAETPIYWSEDDQITITVAGEEYTFVIDNYTPNQTEAMFHCDQAPATLAAGTYKAAYKATPAKDQSGLKSDLEKYQPMSAEFTIAEGEGWSDVKLSFGSNVAIVKLTLSNKDFNGQAVSQVAFKNENRVVVASTSTFSGDADGKIVVYFAVEPQEFTFPTIEVTCGEATYGTSMSANELSAGKLYRISKQMVAKTVLMSGPCNDSGSAAFELYYYNNHESLTLSIYPTTTDGTVITDNYQRTHNNDYTSAPWTKDAVVLGGYKYNTTNIIEFIDIHEGITGIGNHAFTELRSVRSMNIPTTLTLMCEQEVFGCKNVHITDLEKWCNIAFESIGSNPSSYIYLNGEVITDLVIPESITEIKNYAFIDCPLNTVTLHENVKSIGKLALSSYKNRFDVYCKAITPPTGGEGMFDNSSSYSDGTIIHVPAASVESYKTADFWKNYANKIIGDL